CRELTEPYGIPYRCLLPREMRNLLVASRAGSFSSIAASSCRLSRTMMHLGQAAGTAAAMAVEGGYDPADVPTDDLRAALRDQHVQLRWPMPRKLRAWMIQATERR
ncbi:MAG: FAD-dependent oxidoreductase, partial [Armatimonadota bacterium]